MNRGRQFRVSVLVLTVVVAAGLLEMGGAVRSGALTTSTAGSWLYPNGDLANTRVVTDSSISSTTVNRLQKAWTFRLTGKAAKSLSHLGSLVATPIVANGVVYIQDLRSNVYALSFATGTLRWEYSVNKKVKSGPGPNGVAVAGGVVYGLTPLTAFALNAQNGDVIWLNRHPLTKGQGTFGMQPQVADGRVYAASQYGSGRGGGVLLALRASNGDVEWTFNTVAHRDPGVKSVGLGSGGAWETPLVSTDGTVTYGTGNPYQSLKSAVNQPASQLYTNSEVNLDAATGRLRWYYQSVPNDFKDYDMQASPISTEINGTPVDIGGGKMGIVYAMDARNGKLLWKTPIGVHNGHDNDSLDLLDHLGKLKIPFSYEPGSLGGILTNMSVAGNTVYAVTCNVKFAFTRQSQVIGAPSATATTTGDVVALDLATGKVEWDTKVSQLPLGATTVANDLVFTTLYDGDLIALNRHSGAIVYQLKLPTSTNAAIAIAGNTIIVPAGGPETAKKGGGKPQVVAFRLP